MTEEFRSDLRDVVRRHAGDLDGDDLMVAADDLAELAERWEVVDDVL